MVHRILVVDDDPATRIGLAALLANAGYDVMTADTLADAMQVLADHPPHLLITDVRLRGYNGLQLIALSPVPLPSIVITGFPDRTIETEARQLGAEYLQKPIDPPALIALIRQLLGRPFEPEPFHKARRWERKPVTAHLPVRVDDVPAQVIDISYGGLRLEIERVPAAWLPPSFNLVMPNSGVSVEMDLVWQKRTGAARWLCGAAVSEQAQSVWRQVVDAL
jgi:DNA-binding response OmpR family regulator